MKSYAAIEEISKKFAACELELIPVEESQTTAFAEKETEMVDIPMEMITSVIPDIAEGDIIVVIHDCGNVESVCYKDDSEKQRRIELIKVLLGK